MVNPTLSNISPSRCNYVIAGYGYECLVTSSHLTRQKSPKYISLEDLPKRSFFVSQALLSRRTLHDARCTRTHLIPRKQWSAVSLQSSFCTSCPIKIHRVCLPKFGISIPPFFRLASNAFPDIGSIGRIEKKNVKKNLGIGGPGSP